MRRVPAGYLASALPLNQVEKARGLCVPNDLEAPRGKKGLERLVGDLPEKGRPMQRRNAMAQILESELAL